MENKLQQLTEKLYNEGLSKGQQKGEEVLEQAQTQAHHIIAEAKAQADKIIEQAQSAAAELKTNTENEVRLASSQAVSALRQQIEKLIVAQVVTPNVSSAWKDGKFIKELILNAVKAFNPTAEQGVKLVVPEAFMVDVKAVVAEQFKTGVTVVTDARVKVPFRIAPENGGYYISFTDADFDMLFKAYVRPRVAEFLYKK